MGLNHKPHHLGSLRSIFFVQKHCSNDGLKLCSILQYCTDVERTPTQRLSLHFCAGGLEMKPGNQDESLKSGDSWRTEHKLPWRAYYIVVLSAWNCTCLTGLVEQKVLHIVAPQSNLKSWDAYNEFPFMILLLILRHQQHGATSGLNCTALRRVQRAERKANSKQSHKKQSPSYAQHYVRHSALIL
jgi:hypothetical protein